MARFTTNRDRWDIGRVRCPFLVRHFWSGVHFETPPPPIIRGSKTPKFFRRLRRRLILVKSPKKFSPPSAARKIRYLPCKSKIPNNKVAARKARKKFGVLSPITRISTHQIHYFESKIPIFSCPAGGQLSDDSGQVSILKHPPPPPYGGLSKVRYHPSDIPPDL